VEAHPAVLLLWLTWRPAEAHAAVLLRPGCHGRSAAEAGAHVAVLLRPVALCLTGGVLGR
jgi:hypothetical protein